MSDRKKREWTKGQKEVIALRDRDLLVSAAAGSGKTAVLVERILSRITDREHPVDIDHILVVTFTRAAAREMKERLYAGIAERMAEDPGDANLPRQLVLLANAQVSTIDSFCIALLREYFERIDLDPDFRMADEGELTLLTAEIWDSVLEEAYSEADPGFLELTDLFAKRGRDDKLVDILNRLYRESMSYPWPDKWLDSLLYATDSSQVSSTYEMPWLLGYAGHIRYMLDGLLTELYELIAEIRDTYPGHPYLDAVSEDADVIGGLAACESVPELVRAAELLSFPRLSSKKAAGEDTALREKWKERRNSIKDEVTELCHDISVQPIDTIEESLAYTHRVTEELIGLLRRFIAEFDAEKRRRGILDFSDAEHLALRLIADGETGGDGPLAAALRERYEEIMVDEYQDTNELQELILQRISRSHDTGDNYFMVGDIKQSIYRFRQARPEIFAGKYHDYTSEPSKRQRIDLSYNFRSRREILDAVNDVFSEIMHADLGGVEYDEAARLRQKEEQPFDRAFSPELLIINADDPVFAAEHLSRTDVEAMLIARRIRELMSTQRVKDPDTGEIRPLRYGDIAILNRGANTIGDGLCEILADHGIPAYTAAQTGYFDANEVRIVLAVLALIVNPMRDIELAAVLKSPMAGLSDADLALIGAKHRDMEFCEAVAAEAAEAPENSPLAELFAMLSELRRISYDTPIHHILTEIYRRTGYFEYVRAMPKGAGRAANLEKLVDMAVAYEKSSYSGLASFIGYIERQREYEVDRGRAIGISGAEDSVSVMTIHKSKGLEFPVVILSGLGKQFNTGDWREEILIHPGYGLGIHTRRFDGRAKLDNLHRRAIAHYISEGNKGEEQRVLYVAMTRARDRLIMTAGVNEKHAGQIAELIGETGPVQGAAEPAMPAEGDTAGRSVMSYRERYAAKGYLDWVLPVFVAHSDKYVTRLYDASDMTEEDLRFESKRKEALAELSARRVISEVTDDGVRARIEESMSYRYPYETAHSYKNKYSVSDIKHEAILQGLSETAEAIDDAELPEFLRSERPPVIPRFAGGLSAEEENRGALRGVAMHRYLECYDFTVDGSAAETYEAQLAAEMEKGLLTSDQRKLLSDEKLIAFLESGLASRMSDAARAGRLHKEHAFVMSHEMETSVPVLVQGIIDAFFEEDDGIVLVDYKTDRIKTAAELINRYKTQIELYDEAIERAVSRPVKERYLYSFALGEAVEV